MKKNEDEIKASLANCNRAAINNTICEAVNFFSKHDITKSYKQAEIYNLVGKIVGVTGHRVQQIYLNQNPKMQ